MKYEQLCRYYEKINYINSNIKVFDVKEKNVFQLNKS